MFKKGSTIQVTKVNKSEKLAVEIFVDDIFTTLSIMGSQKMVLWRSNSEPCKKQSKTNPRSFFWVGSLSP